MSRLARLGLLLVLLPAALGAEPPAFLSSADREELGAKGSLVATGDSLETLRLWRGAPFAAELRGLTAPIAQTLAAEAWLRVELPPRAERGEEGLAVLRAFSAFSTMKGLRARSAIFSGREPFILESYRVDSAGDGRRLPDPRPLSVPESASFVLYGRDALVGDVFYELRFLREADWYRVTLVNLTTMRSLLLPLAAPGELLTVFYILPGAEGLYLYCLTAAKTPLVPGTVGLERSMLANRMLAIGEWFAGNLAKEYRGDE